jgi:hypothetical protein
MKICELDWTAWMNKEVHIYRNLHNHKISVQGRVGNSWKVIGHVENCILSEVSFIVQESGRKRVLRDRQKNVHAWAKGNLIAEIDATIITPVSLMYDPYQHQGFVERKTENLIASCRYLAVRNRHVFVSQDALSYAFITERQVFSI